MYKSQTIDLFYPGLEESPYYRIPSLALLKNGDLLAAADQRLESESDWGGLIEPALRIKKKGEDDFSDLFKAFMEPRFKDANPTYTIDTNLTPAYYEPGNKVYMVIDKFRSSGNYLTSKKGTGYVEFGGEKYPILFYNSGNTLLFEKAQDRFYIKDGKVYGMDHSPSPYRVCMEDSYPFDKLGNIYEGDKLVGNIYSESSFLRVHQTSYLWFTYSEDGGKTWASPVDISHFVADDRMIFMGVCPGRGLQLASGRILIPLYYTTENKDDIYDLREHACLIYSDDFGKTWSRSKSVNDGEGYSALAGKTLTNTSESQLVRLNDGTLILFSRTTSDRILYSYSYDDGETFEKALCQTDFDSESFCMVSVLKYDKDGKEYILVANPKGPGRNNGYIRVMEVGEGNKLRTIRQKQITDTNFTYSCLEYTGKDDIFALLFEQRQKDGSEEKEFLKYIEFDFEYLMN
ncbi:sialidase family protein [uncultured Anaerococcus sp.]|uniref:sialidase family protein n=1 Tax=uncultured Anaerococcus sp. TaxID=293428 RepID=UPI00288BCE87|nr:sialidase family protein [uncultured Anaerococcus sp.]